MYTMYVMLIVKLNKLMKNAFECACNFVDEISKKKTKIITILEVQLVDHLSLSPEQ